VHDAEGDRKQGIVTLANWLGDQIAFSTAWGLIILLLGSIPIALRLLPMKQPLLFMVFSMMTLLSLGVALGRYQHQRNEHTYEGFIQLERLSMVLGIIGLSGTAPP
jgi:geranylgeranylglycerol-phosphate geranylgeranyltransferase